METKRRSILLRKVDKLFQEELWAGYEVIDVFFVKENTTSVYGSWVKHQCLKGHITNTSAVNLLHNNNQCGNIECVLQKSLRTAFRRKMFTFENGKTSCYEHYLLQLLAKIFPIESSNTSIDIFAKKKCPYLPMSTKTKIIII